MVKEDLLKRYGINLEKLKKEQISLAKSLEIKQVLDSEAIGKIGAIENIILGNKIISVLVVCDKSGEILEQQYFVDRLRFPYLFGFTAYREVGTMAGAYNKVLDKPDIVLINGEGTNHERLGIASHFSLITGVPTIGVSDKLFEGNVISGEDIMMNEKRVGKVFKSREGSRPLYISVGNKVSLSFSYDFIKGLIKLPHKMPEPMHMAHKYAKEVSKELSKNLS